MREFTLRGSRNYSIRVPITPDKLHEIENTWNDHLKQEGNQYNGNQLRVRAQFHPEFQKRLEVMGKVSDWAKDTMDEKIEPKPFWAPDFTIMVNYSQEEGPHGIKPGGLLCQVLENGTIQWDPQGLKAVSLASAAVANNAVAKYRRPRR